MCVCMYYCLGMLPLLQSPASMSFWCLSVFQVANFALAGLDLALLFSFGGQTNDKLGLVEPTPSASLVFTLFVGLLCMPGALIHVLLAGTLLVDATMLTSNHKEKLAGVRAPFVVTRCSFVFCAAPLEFLRAMCSFCAACMIKRGLGIYVLSTICPLLVSSVCPLCSCPTGACTSPAVTLCCPPSLASCC